VREIKFRAWLKNHGVLKTGMYEVESWWFDLKSIEILQKIITKDFEIMQFTGIKDTNGVEIYEGDIIKHPSHGMGIVKWIEIHAAFMVVGGNIDYVFDSNCMESDSREVVGNIYENKELIK